MPTDDFSSFFAIDPDSYLGQTDFNLFPAHLAADFWSMDLEALRKQAPVIREHVLTDKLGRRYLRSVHQLLQDTDGNPTAFITEAEDISLRKQAEDQLRITARVFDQSGEAIVVTDPEGNVQTVNPAFTVITGYAAEDVVNQPIRILKSGRHSRDFYASMWQVLHEQGYWQGEIWNKRKDGEIFPEWLTINRVDDSEGLVQHYVGVFSDITSIKDSQRKVEYLATHEHLDRPTQPGAPTRMPDSAMPLAQARRKKTRVALLFIDLDDFQDHQRHPRSRCRR